MQTLAVFTSEFTLGNLATLALGLLSWGLTAGKYLADQRSMREKLNEQGAQIAALNSTGGAVVALERSSIQRRMDDHEERIRELEIGLGRLEAIEKHTQYVRDRIDRALRESPTI